MLGYDINKEYLPRVEPKTHIKNICVPFNFSDCAYVGLDYAARFAKMIQAEVTILHCFQSTALEFGSASDVAYTTETYERKNEILEKVPLLKDIYTLLKVEHAFLTESLKELCEDGVIDLVIMGSEISGERNKMFGTNASSLIGYIDVPLIIIPDDLSEPKLNDILFAVDYKEFEDLDNVDILKLFSDMSDAAIHIVHVSDNSMSKKELNIEAKLETCFKGVKHKFYQYNYPKIHEGLKDFAQIQSVDMIAMTPRERGFIESMYKSSETKKMALDTKIPLLIFNQH